MRENNIKAVFTFDGRGISSHPNHIAIYNGIKDLEVLEGDQTIKVYYLESVCLMRKYLGWTECLWTLLRTYSWHNWMWIDGYRCMSMHKSQFVWYRRLWVFFSRYNYINTYERKLLRIWLYDHYMPTSCYKFLIFYWRMRQFCIPFNLSSIMAETWSCRNKFCSSYSVHYFSYWIFNVLFDS